MSHSLILFTLLSAAQTAPAPKVAFSYNLVINVASREAAADEAVKEAERRGGYSTSRSDDALNLKVPTADAKEVVAACEKLGKVIGRSREAQDLGAAMLEQRTLLKSREDVLKRYYAVLASAGASSVVEVEQAMTQLVEEIESLKGALKLAEHQLQYTDIHLAFRFRDRAPPVADGKSSFKWLNTVNLAELMEVYGHE